MNQRLLLMIFALVGIGCGQPSTPPLKERIAHSRNILYRLKDLHNPEEGEVEKAIHDAFVNGLDLLDNFDAASFKPTPYYVVFSNVQWKDYPPKRLHLEWIEVDNAVTGFYLAVGKGGTVHEFPIFDPRYSMFEPRTVHQQNLIFLLKADKESRSQYKDLATESVEMPPELLENIYGRQEKIHVGLLYDGDKRSPPCEAIVVNKMKTKSGLISSDKK